MTIAIGVVASDGVVLAADSEETIPGYLKRDETKILVGMGREKIMVAASGAGHAHYLDKVNSAITDIVMKGNKAELDEVERGIQEYLKQFYREHILPFASYPAEERPDISLVIAGASPEWGRALWTTSSNLVKRQTGYGAVGVGGFFATSMLSRLYFPGDIASVSMLAAYVLFHVKETIPDCGKDTHLVCIGDKYRALPLYEMRALEETFRFYESVERDNFHYAVGMTNETTSPTKALEHARERIMRVEELLRS